VEYTNTDDFFDQDRYLAIISVMCIALNFFLGIHGVYSLNSWDLAGFQGVLALVLFFIIYRFVDRFYLSGLQNNVVEWVILIVAVVGGLLHTILAFFVFKSFSEYRFDHLTPVLQGNEKLRGLFSWYECWGSLLKQDFVLSLIVITMGLFFFLDTDPIIISLVILTASGVGSMCGHMGVKLEDKRIMIAFFCFTPILPAFLFYDWDIFAAQTPSSRGLPLPVIFVIGILFIIFRILLIIMSVFLIVKIFGNGLKEQVFDPEEEEEPSVNEISEKQIVPPAIMTIKKLTFKQTEVLKDFRSKMGSKITGSKFGSMISKSSSTPQENPEKEITESEMDKVEVQVKETETS